MQEMRGLNTNLFNFNSNKDILNSSVAQFGAETYAHDALKGFYYGYNIGKEGTTGEGKVIARRNNEIKKKPYTETMGTFISSIKSMNSARDGFGWYVGGIFLIIPLLVIANSVPVVGIIADVIAGFIGAGTIAVTGTSAGALAKMIVDYIGYSNSASSSYNKL